MTLFHFIELSSIILFIFYLNHARKNSGLRFFFLALFFAVLFENLSIVLFAGQEGGYFYHDGFSLFVFETPLFIILFWSAILYSSYEIVKRISNKKQVLFLAPLYVMSLDVVMDVVAVKMGLWTWLGFESGQGFYGVPASNYLGWLVLPFSFILTWQLLNKKGYFLLLQPFLAFLIFLAITLPLYFLKNIFSYCDWQQYLLCSTVFVVFVVLSFVFKKKPQEEAGQSDFSLFFVRIFLHLFVIAGILFLGLYKELLLMSVFFCVLMFEAYVFRTYIARQS